MGDGKNKGDQSDYQNDQNDWAVMHIYQAIIAFHHHYEAAQKILQPVLQ